MLKEFSKKYLFGYWQFENWVSLEICHLKWDRLFQKLTFSWNLS